MKKVELLFEEYLSQFGGTKAVQLGEGADNKVTQKHSDFLESRLDSQIKFNNIIIIIAILLLCLLFLMGALLILNNRNNPTTINYIFGGTFLSLLSIVAWLRKLWFEKSILDMASGVVRNLPPEKAAEFVSSIYWRMAKK